MELLRINIWSDSPNKWAGKFGISKPLPDRDILRLVLDYDWGTGALTWRKRPVGLFKRPQFAETWNKHHAGNAAFTRKDRAGYHWGELFWNRYRADRIIWKLMTGDDLERIVHLNGDVADDRADNLDQPAPAMA